MAFLEERMLRPVWPWFNLEFGLRFGLVKFFIFIVGVVCGTHRGPCVEVDLPDPFPMLPFPVAVSRISRIFLMFPSVTPMEGFIGRP